MKEVVDLDIMPPRCKQRFQGRTERELLEGKMAKILFAEDDPELSLMVVGLLQDENHQVDHADNGSYAQELLRNYQYDLAILDWELPPPTGLEICTSYRQSGGKLPVLFLTGRTDSHSRVKGLDSGADDYICKPFDPPELLARIRSALRRVSADRRTILSVANISYDPLSKTAYRGDLPLSLVKKELAILEFFLRNPDEVFSLEALVARVWASESDVSPLSLRPYIKRLRDKIQDENGYCPIITVHRLGYRFSSTGN